MTLYSTHYQVYDVDKDTFLAMRDLLVSIKDLKNSPDIDNLNLANLIQINAIPDKVLNDFHDLYNSLTNIAQGITVIFEGIYRCYRCYDINKIDKLTFSFSTNEYSAKLVYDDKTTVVEYSYNTVLSCNIMYEQHTDRNYVTLDITIPLITYIFGRVSAFDQHPIFALKRLFIVLLEDRWHDYNYDFFNKSHKTLYNALETVAIESGRDGKAQIVQTLLPNDLKLPIELEDYMRYTDAYYL